MVRVMCGVQLKYRKRVKDLMLTLGLMRQEISWLWQIVSIGMVMC